MAAKYEYVKKCIEERRAWLDKLKDKPCKRCKRKFIACVMEWHHRDPKVKRFSVGSGSFRRSRKQILEEIAKCDLYCANCHRIVEFLKRLLQDAV